MFRKTQTKKHRLILLLVSFLAISVPMHTDAETGPEAVNFFCTNMAAARGSVDPDTREILVELRQCGRFLEDYGFHAFGEFRFVEEIEGTDKTIWLVDFHNTIRVYTVR